MTSIRHSRDDSLGSNTNEQSNKLNKQSQVYNSQVSSNSYGAASSSASLDRYGKADRDIFLCFFFGFSFSSLGVSGVTCFISITSIETYIFKSNVS